jgi:hypothetical protein
LSAPTPSNDDVASALGSGAGRYDRRSDALALALTPALALSLALWVERGEREGVRRVAGAAGGG